MRKPIFTGSGVAIVTPFDGEGHIHFEALEQLIDLQIAAGTDAIVVCGTTGEAATMSPEEQASVVACAVRKAAGRVPVVAGAGCNNTAAGIRLAKGAEEAGADALLVVTPYYNKTTQMGLIRHYTAIADAVTKPIILYNVPSRTGLSFAPETYRTLSQNPQFLGVKEASGSLSLALNTRRLCPEDFYLWSGNDDQTVPLMSIGAVGVISVAANLFPDVVARMSHLCLAGDYRTAAELQVHYIECIQALFSEVNPVPIKAAMKLVGLPAGSLRLPLVDISPEKLRELRRAMERVGIKTVA